MFNREAFLSLFQTEEDWRAFYKMVFDEKIDSLNKDDGLIEYEKRTLIRIMYRINDTWYEAEGEADKYWLTTDECKAVDRKYLEMALRDVSEYDHWLSLKYANRKLIHTDWNPYGEFQKPETTAGGNTVWKNDDIEAIV